MSYVVMKVGTGSITQAGGGFNLGVMEDIVGQASIMNQQGHQAIIVSSGAVGAGRGIIPSAWHGEIPEEQGLAGVGQPLLVAAWNMVLAQRKLIGAQILLERGHFENTTALNNLQATLRVYRTNTLFTNVIPIVNENDIMAVDELRFSDNDELAARLAIFLEAKRLVLLTGVEGVYEDFGTPQQRLVKQVNTTEQKIPNVGDGASSTGRGGVASKSNWAWHAAEHGVPTHVAAASRAGGILELLRGDLHGTLFHNGEPVEPLLAE